MSVNLRVVWNSKKTVILKRFCVFIVSLLFQVYTASSIFSTGDIRKPSSKFIMQNNPFPYEVNRDRDFIWDCPAEMAETPTTYGNIRALCSNTTKHRRTNLVILGIIASSDSPTLKITIGYI